MEESDETLKIMSHKQEEIEDYLESFQSILKDYDILYTQITE